MTARATDDRRARQSCDRIIPEDTADPGGMLDDLSTPSFKRGDEPVNANVRPTEPFPTGPGVTLKRWVHTQEAEEPDRAAGDIWVATLYSSDYPGNDREQLQAALDSLHDASVDPRFEGAILHIEAGEYELDSADLRTNWWSGACHSAYLGPSDGCDSTTHLDGPVEFHPEPLLFLGQTKARPVPPRNFAIVGAPGGRTVLKVSGRLVARGTNPNPRPTPTGGVLLQLYKCENFVLQGLILDGNREVRGDVSHGHTPPDLDPGGVDFPAKPSKSGRSSVKLIAAHGGGRVLVLGGCTRFDLVNVEARHAPSTGIDINGIPGEPAPSDIRLVNCRAKCNAHIGLAVEAAKRLRVLGGEFSFSNGFWSMAGIDLESRPEKTPKWPEIAICDVVIEGARFEGNWKDIQVNKRHRTSNVVIRGCTFIGTPERLTMPPCRPYRCDPADVRCGMVVNFGEVEYWVHRSFAVATTAAWVWIIDNEFRSYTTDTRAMLAVVEVATGSRGYVFVSRNTFADIEGAKKWEIEYAMHRSHPILVRADTATVHVTDNTWLASPTLDFGECFVAVKSKGTVVVEGNRVLDAWTGAPRILPLTECKWL